MSLTIRENILENIKTTLAAIATPTYDNTIASVQRWIQRGNVFATVPCIIITAGPQDNEPGPNPQQTNKLTVFLDLFYRQAETATASTETALNSLLGDIQKALLVDYTRGGLAQETLIMSITPFETTEGQPLSGLIIELEITYKHLLSDPKTYL